MIEGTFGLLTEMYGKEKKECGRFLIESD